MLLIKSRKKRSFWLYDLTFSLTSSLVQLYMNRSLLNTMSVWINPLNRQLHSIFTNRCMALSECWMCMCCYWNTKSKYYWNIYSSEPEFRLICQKSTNPLYINKLIIYTPCDKTQQFKYNQFFNEFHKIRSHSLKQLLFQRNFFEDRNKLS